MPLLAIALFALVRVSAQTTVSVTGQANIYGSGFGTAPDGAGSGSGGILPTEYLLPAGTATLTFSNVTGTVSFGANQFNIPDGGTFWGALTQASSYNSLSGITYSGRTAFLTGVFLDATTPTGTAPATLSYDDTSAGASSFSPVLQQVFFVGDGLDASSLTQIFNVPSGATRLYLGFIDAWNGSTVTGLPGYYGDDGGTLCVTINAMIPEPATVSLLLGLGSIAAAVWRKRVQQNFAALNEEAGNA